MAAPTTTPPGHWINAELIEAGTSGSERIEVVNPATGDVIAAVPAGTPADVDRAVAAAKAAFPGWSNTDLAERIAAVERLSEGLKARAEEIAASITAEMGSPIGFSRQVQAVMPVATSAGVAKLAKDFAWSEEIGNSLEIGRASCRERV